MVTRTGFAFSRTGSHAACLASDAPGRWAIETWTLGATPSTPVRHAFPVPRSARSQLIVLDGGAVMLCQVETATEHSLTIGLNRCTVTGLGVRVLPGNARWPAIGVATSGAISRILSVRQNRGPWRITELAERFVGVEIAGLDASPDQPPGRIDPASVRDRDGELELETICEVPGLIAGGIWVDDERLAFTRARDGVATGIFVNTRTGLVSPVSADRPTLRILLAGPGCWIVGDGPSWTGWCRPDALPPFTPDDLADQWDQVCDRESLLHWPIALESYAPAVLRPLAVSPDGEGFAFGVDDGATSRLVLHDVAAETITPVPLPPGVLGATATWTEHGLDVPFAPADRSAGILRVSPDYEGLFKFIGTSDESPTAKGESSSLSESGDSALIREEVFSGDVRTVVHGDLRNASRVVVALHGGPDAAWQVRPDPLLSALSERGAAVVAINPRGSRGTERTTWGSSDLEDVCTVAEILRKERQMPLGLVGSSYGAYLGLLALERLPDTFDRAAILAPFVSVERLRAEAGARVNALLDRHGVSSQDTPDVLQNINEIKAFVLLAVGTEDNVVPNSHARELRTRLTSRTRYLEVSGAGHDLLAGPGADKVFEAVLGLFASPGRAEPEP